MDAFETGAFGVTVAEGSSVVRLSGEFDLHAVRALTAEVNAFLATSPTDVVIDMSTVDFIDSSGIALMLKILARVVNDGGGTIRVVNASGVARRTFELCGLIEAFGFDPVDDGSS